MSEEKKSATASAELSDPTEAMDVVEQTIAKFLETADVKRVYGEPIYHGDTAIIPAAEVLTGLGFGAGYGSGNSKEDTGGGGGGGGGGRTLARPVAVIIASPEGVRVQEVVDPTKIALAALTAGGFMLGMLLRIISPRRAMRELKSE